MEPGLSTAKNTSSPAARRKGSSFEIGMDPSDDDPIVSTLPADGSVGDPWAGVEAPSGADAEEPVFSTDADPLATEAPSVPSQAPEPVARIGDPDAASDLADEKTIDDEVEEGLDEEIDEEEDESDPAHPERGGWVVALVGAGVAIIAACVLLPLAEENHQLAWQREKLKTDLAQIQQQVSVNEEFLTRVSNDPTLAERLAQRQMKLIRKGTHILELPETAREETSPFQLVSLPPPAPMPEYQPLGGVLSIVIRNAQIRLYLTGIGLVLVAVGLIFGGGKPAEA